MKRIYYLFFALLALAGCRKDAFNGAAPVIVFDQEKLEAVVDADLQISGVITAGNGIAEFSIVNEAYGVNRHETFADGRQPAEYGFITEFSVPSGLKTDQEIVVSVTDAAGRTAQNSLKVFFLADETAPSVNLTASALIYPDAVSGGASYNIEAFITDNQELDHITLECAALNLDRREALYGSAAEYAYLIENISDGEYEIAVKAYDKTGNCGERTILLRAVTDTEDPVLNLLSAASVDEILEDGGTYTYTFKAEVSDNVQLGTMQIMLIDSDWNKYSEETIDLSGKSGETVERQFTFTERCVRQIYCYLTDASTSVQSWGNDIESYISINLHSADTEAPSIEMTSPSDCILGESYVLRLTFKSSAGFDKCWPKVTVYNENGDQPTEIENNWGGWWPEVSGTECSVEQNLTFTKTGTYKVWIDSVTDKNGGTTEGKEWFTITVTGEE